MAYQSPLVRHLAWCLFSEPMVHIPNANALSIEPSSEILNWLTQLDENPQPLRDYLSDQNARLLGSYFECLWQFFFENAPNWQLLAHHVQVFENNQTLGELDILAKGTQQQALHVELAVKFYLLPKEHNGQLLNHWIGPQSRDRLDKKVDKFINKQLPFIKHPHTQQTLQSKNLPDDYLQAVVLKGYLFEHISTPKVSFPSTVNSKVNLGKWLHAHEHEILLSSPANWIVIPKLDWLGPFITANSDLPTLDNQALSTHIQAHFTESDYPYALMLVKLDPAQEQEIERFLVVHDQWPTPLNIRHKKTKTIS